MSPTSNVTKTQAAKVVVALLVMFAGYRLLNDAGYQFEVLKDHLHLEDCLAVVLPKIWSAGAIMFCGVLAIVGAIVEALPKRATMIGRVLVSAVKVFQILGVIGLLAIAAIMGPVYGSLISLTAATVAIGWGATVITSKPPGVQVIGCGTEHDG
jgi:hypothetical protein